MSDLEHVVVTGSHGLIGTALCERLRADGVTVTALVRHDQPSTGGARWNPDAGTIDASALDGCTAVVHLAGVGIADRRWTEAHKRAVLESRVKGTSLLATTIAALDNKPAVFASGSAVGFYGDRGDTELDETAPRGEGFLADVVCEWERSTQPAQDAGVRTVLLRTGVVLSTRGGALAKQLLPFRLGLGGRLGNGRQYLPWISLPDEISAIMFALKNPVQGPVNLVAPQPVTNAQFTKGLGNSLHRPTLLPVPLFALKARYGQEMVQEMLLSSTRAVPRTLLAQGFSFEHAQLDTALRYLLSAKA